MTGMLILNIDRNTPRWMHYAA